MIEISVIAEIDKLKSLKSGYLERTTAPLDGMWLCGFVPMAKHFSFHNNSSLIGYCCINDEGQLLQFHLDSDHLAEGTVLLTNMIAGKYDLLSKIKGAFVSTAEPDFLSLCFDTFTSFKVNAMMFQFYKETQMRNNSDNSWTLRLIKSEHLSEAIDFGLRSLGAPEEWLTQYWSNLVQRRELFGCWLDGELIGTGEHRKFEEVQQGYVDIGVIVDPRKRGDGLATWIVQQLVQMAIEKGLKLMCSTEQDNIGAQKVITKAGFLSRNRIIHFTV